MGVNYVLWSFVVPIRKGKILIFLLSRSPLSTESTDR